jgi:hypothetical protein
MVFIYLPSPYEGGIDPPNNETVLVSHLIHLHASNYPKTKGHNFIRAHTSQ